MRVRIITSGTYPEGMASSYRINCYAKALYEQGMNVEVISTFPHQRYIGKRWGYRGKHGDIGFRIVWNVSRPKNQWLNYFLLEAKSYLLLLHSLLTLRQYDVIWLYGMGFLPSFFLLPLLHLARKKVVLELNEYPYSTEGNKFTRIPFVNGLLQKCTLSYVLPQFDGIVAISENLKKVAKRDESNNNILKVPILLDIARFEYNEEQKERPLVHPYLFHAGTLSERKDGIIAVINGYIKSALELKKIGITLKLVLTNKSSRVWNDIEVLLKEANLFDHLVVTGYLRESELSNWLKNSSALVINKPATRQNKYNFPTKLGDYLLSGRPVIVASQGMELNNFLVHQVNCILAIADNSDSISDAINELVLNPNLAGLIGSNGRKSALDIFDYRVHSERLKIFLSKI